MAILGHGVVVAGPATAAAADKPSYVYGIDDNNTIWEIDPVNKVYYKVNETGLSGTQVSNSMAYDTRRDTFFFMYRGSAPGLGGKLLYWDRSSTGPSSVIAVADLADIGAPGASTNDPANAVYYDNSYWFLGYDRTTPVTTLYRVSFDYSSGKPTDPVVNQYDLSTYAGTTYPGYRFGDIVVDSNTGLLYGSETSGHFFSIDLTKLNNTANQVYQLIKTGTPGMQLSFDVGDKNLYGHAWGTGAWYKVALDGTTSLLGFETLVDGRGFRDLGGASSTPTGATCAITEPGDSNNQSAWPGEAVTNPPSVTVRTQDGQPLPGIDIVFTVTAGGGDLGGDQTVTVITDSDGKAVAPEWTLGTALVPNKVSATNVGTTCDLTFDATVLFSDVEIVKTPSPTTYDAVGKVINYTLVSTNTGNTPLTNVTVTDSKVSSLTCSPTLPVATLAAGAKITCTGPYTITQADIDRGFVDNTAEVKGTDGQNKEKTDSDTAQVTGPPKNPAIQIVKTPDPLTYDGPGKVIDYTLVATNTGNVTLTDVTVTDSKVSSLTCTPTQPVASLAPGAKVTCTGPYTTTQADVDRGKVDNTADVEGKDPDGGKVTDDDTATVTGPPKNPAIDLVKEAAPKTYDRVGQEISYTIVATNTGNVTLTNVKVEDAKIVTVCTPPRPVASLAPGAKVTCTGKYTITQADIDRGFVDNTASTEGTDPDNTKVTDSDKETVTGPPADPSLDVTKSADPKSFDKVGQTITYTIVATNTGNVTLSDVRVTDPLLPSLTCKPATPATLAPGGKTTCTGEYSVTQADLNAGTIPNVATATGKDPSNKPVTDTGREDVPGEQKPGIKVTKSATPMTFENVGQTINYTVVTENTGNVTLTDVQVTDSKIPTLTCSPTTPATLQPGNTITCTGEYVITEDDFDKGEVPNTASAIGTPPDGKQIMDEGKVTVTGGGAADLAITKTHPAGTIYVNDTVTFTLTVKNIGPSRARNVKVVDTLPSQLGYISASGNGWTCKFATPRITCTRAETLASGQTAPVIQVQVRALTAVTNAENVAVVSSTTTDPNPGNNTAKDKVTVTKRPQTGNPPITKETGTIVVKPSKTNANQPVQMKAFCRFKKKRAVAGDTTYCKVKYTKKGGIKVKTNRPYKVRVRMVFWAPSTNEFFAYREVRKYTIKGKKKK